MFNVLKTYLFVAAFAVLPAGLPLAAQQYRAPRTAGSQPNMQGIWQAESTAWADILPHSASLGMPAGLGIVEGGEIPYQPEAAAKQQENFKHRGTEDPVRHCFLPGVPRANYMPFPLQIFQTPEDVAILYEYVHAYRLIPLNGSKHPEDIDFWMGDSRGHWEGDTLVVDVADNNDQTWFDDAGNFHSGDLHIVERYTLTGPDTLHYEATIQDPKTFTRPWKIAFDLYRRRQKNLELMEYDCYAYDEATK